MKQTEYPIYQEIVYTRTLKNGLKVNVLPKKPPYHSTYVELSVPFGNFHTNILAPRKIQFPNGTAHFFEHKIYASPEGDMFSKFAKLGLNPNAYTGYDRTSYLFHATDNYLEGIKLLFKTIDEPFFTEDNVEKEKEIIIEEIHMYEDRLSEKILRRLYKNMYHLHPIQFEILGSVDDVKSVTPQLLNTFHDMFYQKQYQTLTIGGKVDLHALNTLLDEVDQQSPVSYEEIKFELPKEPMNIVKNEEALIDDVEMEMLAFGIKLMYESDPIKRLKQMMSLSIVLQALFGDATTWYQHLLSENVITPYFYYFTQEEQVSTVIFLAKSDDINRLKHEIEQQIANTETFDQKEVKRLLNVQLAHHIRALDDLEHKVQTFAKLDQQGISLFDAMDLQKELKFDDIVSTLHEIKQAEKASVMFKKSK
jgi:predicted Zn-dependent peptidase